MGKVFIETVGCPKNQEDSERMAGLLVGAGHEIVFDPAESDFIIVNTCGFIEAAKRESIDTFFSYLPYREEGRKIIMTGCLTQRYPEELAAELPEADAIFGVNDYDKLPGVVSALERGGSSRRPGPALRTTDEYGAMALPAGRRVFAGSSETGAAAEPRFALSPRHTSYLKIAEGCSNRCAYCAIPDIRGPYRSLPMEELEEEAGRLAAEGCRELILIAQDLTWYGKDLYGGFTLQELLRRLCASEAVKGVEWIRLLYCYAERVTDELIEAMASEPRILKYIDLPLQHINDRILRSMRRAGTGPGIRDTIGRLRKAMPGIVIRTTFITGLPGESEEDFCELYDFVEETRFDRLGVFAYSPEEGTDAASMPGQVDADVAEARRDELMRLQQRISLENNRKLVGSVLDVFVDGRDEGGEDGSVGGSSAEAGECCKGSDRDRLGAEDGLYIGRTRGDAPDIDNAVLFEAPGVDGIIGTIVKVRITDALDYDLVGELESGAQSGTVERPVLHESTE